MSPDWPTDRFKRAKEQLRAHFDRTDDYRTTVIFISHLVNWLECEPAIAIRLLTKMTNGLLTLKAEDDLQITIKQCAADAGPFISFYNLKQMVAIDTQPNRVQPSEQIARRREELRETGLPHTGLVLLTRYPVAFIEGEARPDVVVEWTQIASWLLECQPTLEFSRDLINNFLSHLRRRGVSP